MKQVIPIIHKQNPIKPKIRPRISGESTYVLENKFLMPSNLIPMTVRGVFVCLCVVCGSVRVCIETGISSCVWHARTHACTHMHAHARTHATCESLLHADANNGEVRHGAPLKINRKRWRAKQKTRALAHNKNKKHNS